MGKRDSKRKQIEQDLKQAEQKLDKIALANKKLKDPEINQNYIKAKKILKKIGVALLKWSAGIVSTLVTTGVLTAGFVAVARIVERIDRRVQERAAERGAQERWNQWRAANGRGPQPRPGAAGAQQPRPGAAGARDEYLRRLEEINNQGRNIGRISELAESANTDIGRAADRTRELDLDDRRGGPVNSPGDQSGRFSGLDLDSGYKLRRYKLITHDSMPWSKKKINDGPINSIIESLKNRLKTIIQICKNPKNKLFLKIFIVANETISALSGLVSAFFAGSMAVEGVKYLKTIIRNREQMRHLNESMAGTLEFNNFHVNEHLAENALAPVTAVRLQMKAVIVGLGALIAIITRMANKAPIKYAKK